MVVTWTGTICFKINKWGQKLSGTISSTHKSRGTYLWSMCVSVEHARGTCLWNMRVEHVCPRTRTNWLEQVTRTLSYAIESYTNARVVYMLGVQAFCFCNKRWAKASHTSNSKHYRVQVQLISPGKHQGSLRRRMIPLSNKPAWQKH